MKKDGTSNIHPAAQMHTEEFRTGQISRREFLTRTTCLGVTTAAAYGLLGMPLPAVAQTTPRQGGTLRLNMETKALKDPRTWDWTEYANFCRGWLDYLTKFNRDGTVTGSLVESWDVNETADSYTLHLRPGVTWNNGEPFKAADVAVNFALWADGDVEGNSMAARVAGLQDPATKKLREGAVTVVDDLTLTLTLSAPDISLMAALSDYPAAVVHPSYDGGDPSANPIGTGAYLPEENKVGERQVLVRNPNHNYWQEGGWLDRIEFIDFGTDQATVLAAASGDEIDLTYRTDGDFVASFDGLGWARTEAVTANTIAVRFNQLSAPYDNREVRKALQLAVKNAIVLELAIGGFGIEGENHHVAPVHPEYARLEPLPHDPAAAKAALEAAGHGATEFELISLDTAWQSNTCDVVASQLRDAGVNVKRTVLPGATFWNDWTKYPWSATEWGPRPLGVQVLRLAYRSGEAWNESAFANAEFDALLDQAMSIADAEKRRDVMAKLEKIMQDEGVVIQPYWRSIFNHTNGKFVGVDVHPFYEIDVHGIHLA